MKRKEIHFKDPLKYAPKKPHIYLFSYRIFWWNVFYINIFEFGRRTQEQDNSLLTNFLIMLQQQTD